MFSVFSVFSVFFVFFVFSVFFVPLWFKNLPASLLTPLILMPTVNHDQPVPRVLRVYVVQKPASFLVNFPDPYAHG